MNYVSIRVAAAQIVRHVECGGYIGASWPNYAISRHLARKLARSGGLSAALEKARVVASNRGFSLDSRSQENFSAAEEMCADCILAIDETHGGFMLVGD